MDRKLFIGGAWVAAKAGQVLEIRDPASGEPVGTSALAMAADAWTPENLDAFLTNPKGYAPGTKMSFAGLPKVEDRANLIKYLEATP